jgi:hypothetical protein
MMLPVQLPDVIPSADNCPSNTTYAEIMIEAPRQLVWDVLLDFARYDDWNPFTYKVEFGEVAVGQSMFFMVRMNDHYTRRQQEFFHLVDEPYSTAWGPPPILFSQAMHFQLLTEIDDGKTLYQTWETFTGLLGIVVRFGILRDVQRGFDDMAQALKNHAEQKWQESQAID